MAAPLPREALFWEPEAGGRARCTLCPHRCSVAEGRRGACGVRANLGGRLRTLVYDRVAARHVDPIEKKPLFHFLPGSTSYSIATEGCCLHCAYCQNAELAHAAKGGLAAGVAARAVGAGEGIGPERIVEAARLSGCASVSYTYTEPTVFYELVRDTAILARAAGLRNVLVTCGYITEPALRSLAPLLDAVNVDLKSFRDDTYRRVSRGRLAPVLAAIRLYRELGVWTEITTLVVPGVNDTDEELTQIAGFVRSLGAEVPWHVTRFHPAYRMLDRSPTPLSALRRACDIGRAAGLRHVYLGNVPDGRGESTRCHRCDALLIARLSVWVRENRIRGGRCPPCGEPVAGVGMDGPGEPGASAPASAPGAVV